MTIQATIVATRPNVIFVSPNTLAVDVQELVSPPILRIVDDQLTLRFGNVPEELWASSLEERRWNPRQAVREVVRVESLGLVLLATEAGEIFIASEEQISAQV